MSNQTQAIDFSWTNASVHLRVLASSDLHAALTGYDYFQQTDLPGIGLSRLASLIKQARQEAPHSLLFDNGDLVQGNPLGDWVAQAQRAGTLEKNPFIAALNRLGYDAATLGNHDFNFGLPYIARAVAQAQFPVVVANLTARAGSDRHILNVPKWTLLERSLQDFSGQTHQINIGVFGLTPPQIETWERDQVGKYLSTKAPLDAARDVIPQMRAAGADVIVALCHGGIGRPWEGPENIGLALARQGGVDAIVLGHVHDVFPKAQNAPITGADGTSGTLAGVPAVMPGALGSHLGVIDLRLEPAPDGGWQVAQTQSMARPVAGVRQNGAPLTPPPDDPDITAICAPMHRATLRDMGRVVAQQANPLHSYFAFAGHDLSMRVVTASLRLAGRRFANALGLEAVPILAVGAPFRNGGFGGPRNYTDIPAGDITLRDIAGLYPFPDRLAFLSMTGADLRLWLEHAATAFNTVHVGDQDAALVNDNVPGYHFDVIDGLSYQIDLSQPAQARITDLRFEGAPLNPAAKFLLATNNYRAGGGGGYPGAGVDRIAFSVPDLLPDLVRDNLTRSPSIDPRPFWTFAPLKGTTAVLQTGPGAAAHIGDLALYRPEPVGINAAGFARYRLHLG